VTAEDSLESTAAALAPRVRELADETERGRRLPPELVEAFGRGGIFRMLVPRRFGGGEAGVATMIATLEALSRADGSAGWCAMIGATSGVVAAYLPESDAREIYGSDPHVVSGGVFAPHGRAVAADGGYRLSGRWPFASGCEHCGWLMAGAVVIEDGKPRLLPSGMPDSRLMLFPHSQAKIVDTWNVSGLRGTGSHDLEIHDLFVPAGRSTSIIADRPREQGPLYRFPVFGLLALGGAAVALGIARASIDELVRLAAAKVPTGGRRRLSERGVVQTELAEAEAMIGSARAFLFEACAQAWQAASAASELPIAARARLRLAATHATATSAKVVDLMYNAGGGTSIYAGSPLQRCFRDVHVVTQHVMIARATLELVGRILFGLETDTSML
jgi:alkylation response protein AidB-like acyl-CoA dehydrogenase